MIKDGQRFEGMLKGWEITHVGDKKLCLWNFLY